MVEQHLRVGLALSVIVGLSSCLSCSGDSSNSPSGAGGGRSGFGGVGVGGAAAAGGATGAIGIGGQASPDGGMGGAADKSSSGGSVASGGQGFGGLGNAGTGGLLGLAGGSGGVGGLDFGGTQSAGASGSVGGALVAVGGYGSGYGGSLGATGGGPITLPKLFLNPIIRGVSLYTAEPSALVHGDRVYLYTSHDEATASDSDPLIREWLAFSSNDLVNWTPHTMPSGSAILTAATFTWATGGDARASHVVERDGKFYWYVSVRQEAYTPGFSIGVAVADSPTGPFVDALGAPLVTNDMTPASMLDDDVAPMVFVNDDRKAYLYWGSGSLYATKLKANMIELEGKPNAIPGATGYQDSPWIHKRNGTYYLSYAGKSQDADTPTVIRYATSTQPTGPWKYQGFLMDPVANSTSSHQAIIEFLGEWFVFYHNGALPGGGEWRRSVCVDRVQHMANPDGVGPDLAQLVIQTVAPSDRKRIQSFDVANAYVRHGAPGTSLQQISLGFSVTPFSNMNWRVVPGLANPEHVSFESVSNAGQYLRVLGDAVSLEPNDGSALFGNEATWKQVSGLAEPTWVSFESYAYTGRYFRHWGTSVKAETATTDVGKREATFRLVE